MDNQNEYHLEGEHLHISRAVYHCPLGVIEIGGSDNGIVTLHFRGEFESSGGKESTCRPALTDTANERIEQQQPTNALMHLKLALRELDEYFRGQRRNFSVNVVPEGTEFQKKVWGELLKIPCGETRSYGEIAAAIGQPGAARAVGQANNQNRIAILIPCHRVVGGDGSLTGYASGMARKKWLLEHERNPDLLEREIS